MRSESKSDLLYGRKPVQLFLEKSPRKPIRVWIDRRLKPDLVEKYSRLARGRSVPIAQVDPGQLDRLTDRAVHQGVAVESEPLRLRDLGDLIGILKQSKSPAAMLVLDDVTDPQNFGALCRTAECFGLAGVLFESRHAPPLGGAAYKASAGAIDFLPMVAVPNLVESLRALKSKTSLALLGLDVAGKSDLKNLFAAGRDLPRQIGFVFGSEGRGIRPPVKSVCDHLCLIPMKGRVGSLNVSAAAAAACFWWQLKT